MRSWTAAATVALTLLITGVAFAEPVTIAGGCTEEAGGSCVAIKRDDATLLAEFLTSKKGRYKLCIDRPDGQTECKLLSTRRYKDIGYFDRVNLRFEYRLQKSGLHKAKWFRKGNRIGPVAKFRPKI